MSRKRSMILFRHLELNLHAKMLFFSTFGYVLLGYCDNTTFSLNWTKNHFLIGDLSPNINYIGY